MKNKIYEEWYFKNWSEISRKRKEAYQRRKEILNGIKLYQINNNIKVDEYEDNYHCKICDVVICASSRWAHFKTRYHKYNMGFYELPDPEKTE